LWNLAAGATAKAKGRKREDFSKGQQQNMQAELRGVLSEEDAAGAGAVNGFMMAVPVPARISHLRATVPVAITD
jgi:hypothetical protein